MNSDHIRYFLETVQCGSINKASEKLSINHQHLGRILTSLEDEIGAKLIERNRSGVTLTQQGMEVLELMNNIDLLNQQLKYHFNQGTIKGAKGAVFKSYSYATINNTKYNKFLRNVQSLMPGVSVEIKEASNEKILEYLNENDVATMGTLCSFDDYPSLSLKPEYFSDELEVVSEITGKIGMLSSASNPIARKYDTISIESLLDKPLVIYSPYDIETNHFYKLLKEYGTPNVKYKTENIQTFYELLQSTECVAIGTIATNATDMLNPMFRNEDQLHAVPVRENITCRTVRVVNKYLKRETGNMLRDIIDRHFS